jgi:transcriptional regulator GlxA family with amidase domain
MRIGILLFDGVELLDFAGPMQVLSSAAYVDEGLIESIQTIGLSREITVSKTSMKIAVDELLQNVNELDLLVIPGGFGTREIIKNQGYLNSLEPLVDSTPVVASVCTGSLVLAKLGVLGGLKATTHFAATDIMNKIDPTINVDRSKRYYDNGKYVIAEGVSAGIDMSFYLLKRLFSEEVSDKVKKYIEYYPVKE